MSKAIWGFASFLIRVQVGTAITKRFLCTLMSPGRLFCYVRGKQLQKSLKSVWKGVVPPPPRGARNYMSWGFIKCSTGVSPLIPRQLALCMYCGSVCRNDRHEHEWWKLNRTKPARRHGVSGLCADVLHAWQSAMARPEGGDQAPEIWAHQWEEDVNTDRGTMQELSV